MIEYYQTYESKIVYHLFYELAIQLGTNYWILTGLLLCILFALCIMSPRCIRILPSYMYAMSVLVCLLLLDGFMQLFPISYLYLILLVHVIVRSRREDVAIVTIIYCLAYTMITLFSYWHQYIALEIIGKSLLFLWTGWISHKMKEAFLASKRIKKKNWLLVDKLKHTADILGEYNREIEETYRQDYLTGLYNLGGFQEKVAQEIATCPDDCTYHVITLDLTDFKQINMTHGMHFGDQLLVTVAARLKKELPSRVQLARYDGDQFAIAFRSDIYHTRQCLEKVDGVIQEIKEEGIMIHHCVGKAVYPFDAHQAADLIRLAEQRLSIEQRNIRQNEEMRRQHLEKLSAVGQLAAGLAHEIRNPLTSIRGFVQISATESKEVKKWESIILPEIDRINDLLKQFLNLSESRPAKFIHFNLGKLIGDVLSLLEPKAILMGHEITLKSPKSPIMIDADSEQLKQVLINLIQNGLDSLQEKGQVVITWKQMGDRAILQIKDTGVGIQPEHLSRIFYPFFTTKEEGTGMGLPICHRIISDHDGFIHVTSQPERGTTFNIHLPIQQCLTHNRKEELCQK